MQRVSYIVLFVAESDLETVVAIVVPVVAAMIITTLVTMGVVFLRRNRAEEGKSDVEMSSATSASDDEDPSYLQPLPAPQYTNIPSDSSEVPNPYATPMEAANSKDDQHAYSSLDTAAPSDDRGDHKYESLDRCGRANGQSDSRLVGDEKTSEGVQVPGKETVGASIPGDTDDVISSTDDDLRGTNEYVEDVSYV